MDNVYGRGNRDILEINIDLSNVKENLRKNLQLMKKVFRNFIYFFFSPSSLSILERKDHPFYMLRMRGESPPFTFLSLRIVTFEAY